MLKLSACGVAAAALFGLAVGTPAFAGDSMSGEPAVSEFNGTLEAGAGEFVNHGVYWGAGSFSVPLSHSFGFQADGFVGGIGGVTTWGGAAHLFWRDPSTGLLGFYANDLKFEVFGGLDVTKVGGEGELYLDDVTLKVTAGYEAGNSFLPARFFDRAAIVWYPDDDWAFTIGHRYTLGSHAGIAMAEYQFEGSNISLFAEGRIGEHSTSGGWAGVRFYLGEGGKPLERRQREDDPQPDFIDGISEGGCKDTSKIHATSLTRCG